mgnify:CR=1 FL=1
MKTIKGGCLCNQIRYQIFKKPLFTSVCHCKNCQKQCGTAFSIILVVERNSIKIEGDLSIYIDRGDSGNEVLRKFCKNCGSPILSEIDATPHLYFLKAGTLDDAKNLSPTREIYVKNKLKCLSVIQNTEQYKSGYFARKN